MLDDYAVHGAVLRRYSRTVEQAGRGRSRDGRPVPGVAAGRRPRRVDGADVWDGGRGVRRVHGHARRAGSLDAGVDRGVRRHAGRIPGQDGRAETVRGAVVPAVRLRRRAWSTPPCWTRSRRAKSTQAGQDPVGVGPGRRDQDPGRGRPGQPVREAGLRDHPADHQARAARHRRQTAGVRRFRLAGQPAVRGAGQDRPPGAAAAAEGRRLGGHRLHPRMAGRSATARRCSSGTPPRSARSPTRTICTRSWSSTPGQRMSRSARNAATACIRCGTRWRPGCWRTAHRSSRSPTSSATSRSIDRRVPEIVAGSAGQVRAGPGRAGAREASR